MKSYLEKANQKLQTLRGKEGLILAIESSCDETAAAVTCGRKVLGGAVASQIEIHRRFGGVVPEIASRNHVAAISSTVKEALFQADKTLDDIDAVAVTYGAGLLGALLVGVSFAKALAFARDLPLIAVSHIKGHIAANYIDRDELTPPYVCLLASGGHTALLDVKGYDDFEILGTTRDDAAGEAFDKVARVLGLPYPGGPEIEKLAKTGKANIKFPRPYKGEDTLDFSYSGLKTAVINYMHTAQQKGEQVSAADVAASFQKAAVGMMSENAAKALRRTGYDRVVIAGGVAANLYLRGEIEHVCKKAGAAAVYPPLKYCTDNAAMIGVAAGILIKDGVAAADLSLDAKANVDLRQH